MIKQTLTYTDYNGEKRTEDFYFNLTKAELTEMELSTSGGMEQMLKKIIAEKDNAKIVKMFKELIRMSYGEKSPDGKRFMKSDEIANAFMQTEAYSDLFMKLASDGEFAAEFIRGILPADLAAEVAKQGNTPVLMSAT